MKKNFLFFALIVFMLGLVGCGGGSQTPIEEEDKDITGITLVDKEVTYDGSEHTLSIKGTLPKGVTVSYTNNVQTNVGSYNVTATLSGEGYKSKTLSSTLVIKNRVITGISFNDKEVTYDGNLHHINITGTPPEGVSVTYKSGTMGVTNEYSEVGNYVVTATLSGFAYDTLVLTAKLVILPFGGQSFTGITFENKTVAYDGLAHKIEITGNLPEGTSVVYSSTTAGITNEATEAGTYDVTVTISKEGYQPLTLQAVLTITENETQTFDNITFEDESIEYDSFEHEILVEGVLPEGTTVLYTSNVDGISNKASEVGIYNITVTLSKSGYETLELQAKLEIKAVDKERYIFVDGENIYFNNPLDEENLYVYGLEGLELVNRDEAKFIVGHNGIMYYVSRGLISTSIKSFSGDTAQTAFTANAEYLVSDGTFLYYAVNPLFGDAGIYKLNLDGEEPSVVKVYSGKAKYLTIVGSDIYFANGNDDYKLHKISTTSVDGTSTQVLDLKVKEIINYNGSLYFTVNNLLGDYLARLIISSNTLVKLSSDNAKYLVVAGGYIYYSNVDIINSTVYGKGLYRVPLNLLVDNQSSGELVFETAYNISSLKAQDDSTILFYRLEDKHLVSYDVTNKTLTDIMDDFVPTDNPSMQLLSKFESFVWGNRVYYINNYVDGALFYYDTKTNENIRVTSNGVKSFSIIGDYLYFNQISYLVNNDTYMINLRQGGLPLEISSNDARDMILYNSFLYYVKENVAGVGTAITRLSLDGSFTEVDVYEYNAHHLTIQDGKLYFIKGAGVDEIWRADISANGDLTNIVRLGADKTDWFILGGEYLYYRDSGLIRMNLDGSNIEKIISKYDPISFFAKDGFIYFTNDTLLGPKDGIYRANLDGTNIELLFENTSGNGFGIEMHKVNNYLYFYSRSGSNGDGHFYRLNLTTLQSELIN